MDFLTRIKERAKSSIKTIVLPEAEDIRVLTAASKILSEGFAKIVLLGEEKKVLEDAKAYGLDLSGAKIINPLTSELFENYAKTFYEMRKKKGISEEDARKTMQNFLYFGIMMVEKGDADGMVAGAINSTSNTIRPALQILKTAPGFNYVSAFMVLVVPNCSYGHNGTFVYSDVGLTEDPDARNLAEIAIAAAGSFKELVESEPRVAMLSYSTKGSAKSHLVDKVQAATKFAKEMEPNLILDGELQFDAAILESVAIQKAKGSPVEGKANVLVFPDLNVGNIAYKMTERLAKAQAYGPLLQGIKKPVNDLSRACSADDIVGVAAITCVQAQNR